MDIPTNQHEAKRLGSTRYYTGEPCVHGHDAPRYTTSRRCIVCSHAAAGEYNRAHPEIAAGWARDWYHRNPDHARQLCRTRNRRWREARA